MNQLFSQHLLIGGIIIQVPVLQLLSLDVIYNIGLGFQFVKPGLHQLVPKGSNFVGLRVVSQIHFIDLLLSMLAEELDSPPKVLSAVRLVRFHEHNSLLAIALGGHRLMLPDLGLRSGPGLVPLDPNVFVSAHVGVEVLC